MFQDDAPYNMGRAFTQFMGLYRELSSRGLVYILPSSDLSLQDLPYVANLGCYLPHITDRDVMLLSNYKSEPRIGEAAVGRPFFEALHYEVMQPTAHWEGEADLKWLRGNVYIGGWGQRSDLSAFDWMRRTFDMEIIEVELTDQKLYHLDCSVFPLGPSKILAGAGFKELERYAEIIEVPEEYLYHGWTNSIRIGQQVFHAPHAQASSAKDFAALLEKHDLELVTITLNEFEKSGADLSCFVLHLNRYQ